MRSWARRRCSTGSPPLWRRAGDADSQKLNALSLAVAVLLDARASDGDRERARHELTEAVGLEAREGS